MLFFTAGVVLTAVDVIVVVLSLLLLLLLLLLLFLTYRFKFCNSLYLCFSSEILGSSL